MQEIKDHLKDKSPNNRKQRKSEQAIHVLVNGMEQHVKNNEWIFLFAMLGAIEYMFQHVSGIFNNYLQQQLQTVDVPHFACHNELDKQHAADFFAEIKFFTDIQNAKIYSGIYTGIKLFDAYYTYLHLLLN